MTLTAQKVLGIYFGRAEFTLNVLSDKLLLFWPDHDFQQGETGWNVRSIIYGIFCLSWGRGMFKEAGILIKTFFCVFFLSLFLFDLC